jgi:RNA polymerase sigma-70 factor (ECF subfamily)
MSEEELVRKAQKGDEEAFYKLIFSSKDKLYSMAYCYLKSESDALEAVQEVTCRAYIKLNKLKEPKFFNTWLIKILMNYCIDEHKRRKKVIELKPLEESHEDKSVDAMILEEAIEKLESKFKEVIILKYFQDMTTADIARVMQCPEGTVKTWCARALKQLKVFIGKEGDCNV